MKALILLADNVYLTPYLKFYTSLLDECNIKYDIIFWDKNDNEKTTKDNYFAKGNGEFWHNYSNVENRGTNFLDISIK